MLNTKAPESPRTQPKTINPMEPLKPKIPFHYPEKAGKPYQPSNGTEGSMFEEAFCEQCIHEKFIHTGNRKDKKCQIYSNALVFEPKDKEYPKQWRWGADGYPECTAWVKWDWGTGGRDGNGWNDPPPPEPYDPKQLCFPFIIDEVANNVVKHKPQLQTV